MPRYFCENCGFTDKLDKNLYFCPNCGDPLTITYSDDELEANFSGSGVWRYSGVLPVDPNKKVSLKEGNTPLYKSLHLGSGVKGLYIKNEGMNPTGSFKDRGMTVAITRAIEKNFKSVICASTGNTSASLAIYAARAGIRGYVVVPDGAVALGKMAQARAAGAHIIKVRGNFDLALQMVKDFARKSDEAYLVNSVNPFRIEGQKTVAYEIVEEIGVPDWITIPVGNAGNITALWKGLNEMKRLGKIKYLPKLLGVQASGASPIVKAFNDSSNKIEPVVSPNTLATAIKIGNPASWRRALKAVRESRGAMIEVSDDHIVQAQYLLSSREGIFVEPASAASVAGFLSALQNGLIRKDDTVVSIVTGNGLKDPDSVSRFESIEITVGSEEGLLHSVIAQ
ncbi:MAG: threonine synthase [Nitrososphaerota archaeon]|nr:threonine synthase [Nitrososphaerota archaeon]MDG6930695.1 threonine synthase [Nitrososphaerota archaeon]